LAVEFVDVAVGVPDTEDAFEVEALEEVLGELVEAEAVLFGTGDFDTDEVDDEAAFGVVALTATTAVEADLAADPLAMDPETVSASALLTCNVEFRIISHFSTSTIIVTAFRAGRRGEGRARAWMLSTHVSTEIHDVAIISTI
jgi:hypothetical protein